MSEGRPDAPRMGPQEASQRILWRFGLVFAVSGGLVAGLGALLAASLRRAIAYSPESVYGLTGNIFAALAVAAVAWQVFAAYRDGALTETRYALHFLPHAGLPLVLFGAFLLFSLTGRLTDDLLMIALGAGLAASGAWTMRAKLPPAD